MIVLRKCPAWNGLAILGEENSTIIVLRPLDGSEGSRRPIELSVPYWLLALSIDGTTSFVKGSDLK